MMPIKALLRSALLLTPLLALAAHAGSLRFNGNGTGDIDRVKIQVDDPATSTAGPPADIGATDFTIEFWVRGKLAENGGRLSCGSGYGWITGNIVVDRDRFDQGRAFGISFGGGRVGFGVKNASNQSYTLCSSRAVLDNAWHHIAVTRAVGTGQLSIFIDGVLDATATGPAGDISYPDNGVPVSNSYCAGSCRADPYLVIGAEKHDVDAVKYPAFSGSVDELRLSTTLRYTDAFTPASAPFTADTQTAALYHFDEGTDTTAGDAATGGRSPGTLRIGGNPSGPLWSTDSPFVVSSAGTLAWTQTQVTASESSGSILLSATRSGGSSGAVSVAYAAAPGTAIAAYDFVATAGLLNWADGEAGTKSVTVQLVDDEDAEGTEQFTVALGATTGSATRGAATLTITITDDDDAPVSNPVPITTGLSPQQANAEETPPILTVYGSNFAAGAVGRWNGSARPTVVTSATELEITLTEDDVASPGSYLVGVLNPSPGGGVSNAQTFTVVAETEDDEDNPVPEISSLSPASAKAGAASLQLAVVGSDFVEGSVVYWNGAARTTVFVSESQLLAAIPASDLAAAGTAAVTVRTPAPGGGTSASRSFTITAAATTTTRTYLRRWRR